MPSSVSSTSCCVLRTEQTLQLQLLHLPPQPLLWLMSREIGSFYEVCWHRSDVLDNT